MLRVLTWNLWWRHGDFEHRHAAIEAVLRAEAADVCCLQEVWANSDGTHQGRMLGDALGYEVASTEGPWFSGWSVNNVVLSRFPIARQATVVLPSADGSPSHRRATTAVLATPWGEWPVVATHTEHRFDRSATRVAQCAALAQAVADLRGDPAVDLPVVVGGDLNAVPDSDEIRMLTGRSAPPVDGLVLTDVWEARGDGPGHTWHSANPYLADAAWPNRRLDYLLVSWPRPKPMGHPARVWLAGTEPVDGVMPSDHYAIVADLRTDRAEPAA